MLFQTDPSLALQSGQRRRKSSMNPLLTILLRLMAFIFNWRKSKRRFLKSDRGWVNSTIGIRTRDGECA